MEDVYTRGEGRLGERSEQIRVRSRLASCLRAAIAALPIPWTDLAGDESDWRRLLPSIVA